MKMDFSNELVKIGLAHVKHGLWGIGSSVRLTGRQRFGVKSS